mgnify:CR=1 FL=1
MRPTNAVKDFLEGFCDDNHGRALWEYRIFTDEEMESTHDYIQWMFPTDVPSKFNPKAPLIDTNTRWMNTHKLVVLQSAMQFLGFLARTEHWREKGNHNLLRISRMLRSVALICGWETAWNLYAIISQFGQKGDLSEPVSNFDARDDGMPVSIYWWAAMMDNDIELARSKVVKLVLSVPTDKQLANGMKQEIADYWQNRKIAA